MSKKTKAKSKPVSKVKAKSKSPAKRNTKKNVKAKPAPKKKAPAKPISKSKAKPAPTVKAKAKAAVKAKPPVKSKAPVKPPVKSKPVSVAKPITKVDKNNKPNKPSAAPKEEKKKEELQQPVNRPTIGRPMPVNRRPEPARAIISNSKPEKETGKNRYSDSELEEFRGIINKKLEDARKELSLLQAQMTAANEHGTDDTASTFKILEDGSDSLAKEEAGQLASRQKKFIEQLENAMVRIENKTYGICRVTGKLIPKERLRAVPHTTQSIEAKLNQYRD